MISAKRVTLRNDRHLLFSGIRLKSPVLTEYGVKLLSKMSQFDTVGRPEKLASPQVIKELIMKNAFNKSLILTSALLITAAANAGTDSNDVYLHVNGLTDCSYQVTAHDSTKDYDGTTAKAESGKCKITVKADRKKSSGVADWFAEQVGTGNAIACDSSGPMPDKLNFAVEGTLVLTQGDKVTTCENLVLAQGNIAALFTNNWWLGSPDVKSGGVPYIGPLLQSCSSGGRLPQVVTYSPPQPCVNNFNLVIE